MLLLPHCDFPQFLPVAQEPSSVVVVFEEI